MTEWVGDNKDDWDHHDQVINVSTLFYFIISFLHFYLANNKTSKKTS